MGHDYQNLFKLKKWNEGGKGGGGEKCFFVKKAYWGDEGFHVLEIVMGLY